MITTMLLSMGRGKSMTIISRWVVGRRNLMRKNRSELSLPGFVFPSSPSTFSINWRSHVSETVLGGQ
ncbi:hypothetical protein LINPERPRIM_LOCUS1435 [Linum perenne]